ncbi:putative odorant receptor 71a [Macrosteles quadrilineatus]|uniref:putative odorant receptor 71a n=1 Tax=Macrosteles quadrilineatus TaxID=74068 RepID=UPI0023E0C922|nr:putative odorant receptor 71a [Macrosteles quadrilineatus]
MKVSYESKGIAFKSSLMALIYKDKEILESLKQCVKNHQEILRLSKKLNKVYSVLVGSDILLALFLFCLILFQLTSVPEKQSVRDIIKSLTFLASAGSLIFIVCWLGSELEKVSLLLQHGVFDSGWPLRNGRLNQLLPTILLVSSRPLTLSAGYTYNANLELFASTMRFAYSFYTLLVNAQQG